MDIYNLCVNLNKYDIGTEKQDGCEWLIKCSAFEFTVTVSLALIMIWLVGGSCITHVDRYLEKRPCEEEIVE